MVNLLGLLPLLPLLGFILLALFGKQLGKIVIAWVGVGTVALSAVLTIPISTAFLAGTLHPWRLEIATWMATDGLAVPFGLYLDALSLTMLCVVTGVGFLIHLYAAGYMADDPGYARFFAYMNLFVAAMLLLVLADNLVLLYLGWEGVGLGSYLLIGFWYENPQNGYAARKAFVMTRVGDTALLLGLLLLFTHLGSFNIQTLMHLVSVQWSSGTVFPVTAAALLLIGAVGKSAQLPLQTWLPDAMAGPTPVSALIHAATMVTAGVYLIARTHALFSLAPTVQLAVGVIGALTLLLAGCSALVQSDIKRILAYSTISQIGYMFLALGAGAWSAAIFHLLTHAFFKALLFLAAGAVIVSLHHEQNIFRMGGLRRTMPLAFWSFVIGSAALSALPLTSGYYSKHEILNAVFDVSPSLWLAGCLGALITGIYSFRLVFVVFFGMEHPVASEIADWRMNVALFTLCVLSLIGAMLQIPLASVFPITSAEAAQHGFSIAAVITVITPIIGVAIAAWFYLRNRLAVQQFADSGWINPIRTFWLSGWEIDKFYDLLLLRPFKTLSRANKEDIVDDLYSGIVWLCRSLYVPASTSQNGRVRWYAASMGVGVVLAITIGLLS